MQALKIKLRCKKGLSKAGLLETTGMTWRFACGRCRDDVPGDSGAEPRAGGGARRGHAAGPGHAPDAPALHAGEEGPESAAY